MGVGAGLIVVEHVILSEAKDPVACARIVSHEAGLRFAQDDITLHPLNP